MHKEVSRSGVLLAMEYVSGMSLHDIIETNPYQEKEVHRLLVPLFDAVIYCHDHGISH